MAALVVPSPGAYPRVQVRSRLWWRLACFTPAWVFATLHSTAVVGTTAVLAADHYAAIPASAVPPARDTTRQELLVVVTDSAGRPIAGASVFTEDGSRLSRADEQGRVMLRGVQRDLTIIVRHLGFREQRARISDAGGGQELSIVLQRLQQLPEVTVRGTRPLPAAIERRKLLGGGYVYRPEEIERVDNLVSIIGRTPGARLRGSSGRYALGFMHASRGECWADLYIDGRLVAPEARSFERLPSGLRKFEELQTYPPASIYTIEVYPRVSRAPQDIIWHREGCGVVLVWTVAYAEMIMAQEARVRRRTANDSTHSEPR